MIVLMVFICRYAQSTLIPDPVFEQFLINSGIDTGIPDGSVPTIILPILRTTFSLT
jgi:hypothetical protein